MFCKFVGFGWGQKNNTTAGPVSSQGHLGQKRTRPQVDLGQAKLSGARPVLGWTKIKIITSFVTFDDAIVTKPSMCPRTAHVVTNHSKVTAQPPSF